MRPQLRSLFIVSLLSILFVPTTDLLMATESLTYVNTTIPLGDERYHTCIVTLDGAVRCWGSNSAGQLGNGTGEVRSNVPTDVVGLTSGIASVAVGYVHSCALTQTGAVKCWGNNDAGQLGDGEDESSNIPVNVAGLNSDVKEIAVGYLHTCALTNGGGVKCWGENLYGQLGDGTGITQSVPVPVVGLSSGVSSIIAGQRHTCATMTAGGAKCWGRNSSGQLGDGTTEDQLVPVDVAGLNDDITAIAAGTEHSCVLDDSGVVKCWGNNSVGQLGLSTVASSLIPLEVGGLSSGVSAISAGNEHTCTILTDGSIKCWGGNLYGQLGNGTTITSPAPVYAVAPGGNTLMLTAFQVHTCAISENGRVRCWGGNSYGQLGNGTFESSNTPVDVPLCYTLTVGRQWNGVDPTADPHRSEECQTIGQYVLQEEIILSNAIPDGGWTIAGWQGTLNDSSRAIGNVVSMPATKHTVNVVYTRVESPNISFDEAVSSVEEGLESVEVNVRLSGVTDKSASVEVDVLSGTAQEGVDYTLSTNSLTFAPGETTRTLAINILDDKYDEEDESLTITLRKPQNAVIDSGQTELTIYDNDDAPELSFGNVQYYVSESDEVASVSVQLSVPSGQQVTAEYVTYDASTENGATEDKDYFGQSGTLTFMPGDVVQLIEIPIIQDTEVETDENISLVLTAGINANLGADQAILTIVDDDREPDGQARVGDLYEDDNTCTNASYIVADGSIQERTFHDANDEDWIRVRTRAGTAYHVDIEPAENSPITIRAAFRDRCATDPVSPEPLGPGQELILPKQSTDAEIFLRLTNRTPSLASTNAGYRVSVQGIENVFEPGALILVAGQLEENDELQSNIHHVANQVYNFFHNELLYGEERIQFLSNDPTLNGYDGEASAENLRKAITEWAKGKVGLQRPLTIYIVDHGDKDKIYLNGETEVVTPKQINDWLSDLEKEVSSLQSNIVIEACHSGSFIEGDSQSLSKLGRVVITSSNVEDNAYVSDEGAYFSDQLIAEWRRGANLSSSFYRGELATVGIGYDQFPWLDANGNGKPGEAEDFAIASGRLYKAPSENTLAQLPPVIEVVAAAASPTVERDNSPTIQVNVQGTQEIVDVWFYLVPPSYTPPAAGQLLLSPSVFFERRELSLVNDNIYRATLDDLKEEGKYGAIIHARDVDGWSALPKRITIDNAPVFTMYMPLISY